LAFTDIFNAFGSSTFSTVDFSIGAVSVLKLDVAPDVSVGQYLLVARSDLSQFTVLSTLESFTHRGRGREFTSHGAIETSI